MKDKLEKYISEDQSRFDIEKPPEASWDTIRKGIKSPASEKKKAFNYWKIAASILILVSMTLALLLYRNTSNSNNEPGSLSDIAPQYVQLEKAYEKSISEIKQRIGFRKVDKTEYAWLFEELQILEELNENFRRDIYKVRDKERLVGILIDHYEKKIRILKRLEHEIKRDEQKRESDDSKV